MMNYCWALKFFPEPETYMQICSPISSSRLHFIPLSFSFDHSRIKKISTKLTELPDLTGETRCSCIPLEDVGGEKMSRTSAVEVGGRGGCGSDGGGGGSGGGDGGECWDANYNHTSMDVYYERLIKANPGNDMILTNYATFLKEIRGDFVKAEEYFGRAILENPKCGNVLSLYADLIWLVYQDANRAHIFFNRAVKADPNNCYVMASYARFLWDAEDQIDEHQLIQ